jgi:hypothetical protein
MHRHRRPGWRRCRPLSDIEAMHRQSAQIVRTELLTPGSVKQRITARRSRLRFAEMVGAGQFAARGKPVLCHSRVKRGQGRIRSHGESHPDTSHCGLWVSMCIQTSPLTRPIGRAQWMHCARIVGGLPRFQRFGTAGSDSMTSSSVTCQVVPAFGSAEMGSGVLILVIQNQPTLATGGV